MATELDRAYTAGIIDGEGCVCIALNGPRPALGIQMQCYDLRLYVRMTAKDPVLWLQATWGGAVRFQTTRPHKWLPIWTWQIGGEKAVVVLLEILPFLKVKQAQAKLAADFQARRHERLLKRSKGGQYLRRTAEERKFEETCYWAMRRLHGYGH